MKRFIPGVLRTQVTFNKSLFKADQVIYESYTDHKVYAALVTLDANNNPVNFSSSLCLE